MSESLTIAVDAREISGQPAGKGLYAASVLREILSLDSKVKLVLCVKPGTSKQGILDSLDHPSAAQAEVVEVSGKGVLWHIAMSKTAQQQRAEVVFAPFSYQTALFNSLPTVTTIHDVATFKLPNLQHNRKSQIADRLFLKLSLKKSAHFFAVSESTKSDVVELFGVDPSKITVTLLAPTISNAPVLPLAGRAKQFLYLGTLEPRKNIGRIIEAYSQLDDATKREYRLVLAGKPGWGSEDYPAIAKRCNVEENVDFLGYVGDQDRISLLQSSTALIWPSFYEGFGLPVLEAMSVGTPVVTSNLSSLPEVIGDAGITCDPEDTECIKSGMAKLATDHTFWHDRSAAGIARSQLFSWKRCASETLAVLREFARKQTS